MLADSLLRPQRAGFVRSTRDRFWLLSQHVIRSSISNRDCFWANTATTHNICEANARWLLDLCVNNSWGLENRCAIASELLHKEQIIELAA